MFMEYLLVSRHPGNRYMAKHAVPYHHVIVGLDKKLAPDWPGAVSALSNIGGFLATVARVDPGQSSACESRSAGRDKPSRRSVSLRTTA
jgi:hypothetical protein